MPLLQLPLCWSSTQYGTKKVAESSLDHFKYVFSLTNYKSTDSEVLLKEMLNTCFKVSQFLSHGGKKRADQHAQANIILFSKSFHNNVLSCMQTSTLQMKSKYYSI